MESHFGGDKEGGGVVKQVLVQSTYFRGHPSRQMNPRIFKFFLPLLFLNATCNQAQKKNENVISDGAGVHTNHLINESSPYLLQHAHNPVDWYPWGEEALQKAQRENKLLIISIGYAACHWCHVMEHESFEDTTVARLMNEKFVCIKVDREERPDIDQVYMNAVQLLTGSGGWPLNAIALPDGRPIHGGTYFPKKEWMEMLNEIIDFAKQYPDKVEKQAAELARGIQSSELVTSKETNSSFVMDDLEILFNKWKPYIDFEKGGLKGAPKFPMPIGNQFLLHYHHLSGNEDALLATTTTLDYIAAGGIYDHVGGGFARYATDEEWHIPHFEKMLYDNAQLVSLYSSAYQLTKNARYKTVVYETLEFIRREMTADNGGFYSSLDADSEGEEGKYYAWTYQEMKTALGVESPFLHYFNADSKGNWEDGKNVLFTVPNNEFGNYYYALDSTGRVEELARSKALLLQDREKRIRPTRDEKILTSWNSLMLKAYVDAYRVFGEESFLKAGERNAEFLLSKMKSVHHRLNRNFMNGKSSINGFLDDYAFTIESFIALYQATFDEKWLSEAHELLKYAITHFSDENTGMFFYTSDLDPALIARKMEVTDNVIPSSNSAMAKNLFVLGHYFANDTYIARSKQMLGNIKKDALNGGVYYANWDVLMAWFASDPFEIAIVGNECATLRAEFDQHFLPNVFFSGGKNESTLPLLENKMVDGQTTIYVCVNKTCKLPVTDAKAALNQMVK